MRGIKSQNGFTLTEILIATFIMALGFLAVAQMEFLSLRQKQQAEIGTVATNAIQFVTDRDMAEVRSRHLLNSTAYIDAQASRTPSLDYCNGSATSICAACPCDPLEALTPNPDNAVTETICAAIDSHNLDPNTLVFRASATQCQTDAAALPADSEVYYLVKQTTTTIDAGVTPNIVTVATTYAVKTPTQFDETGLGSVTIRDSLASQTYTVTAHVDDWSESIAGWSAVRVPHIP